MARATSGSKAGRNEERKLLATFVNNLAVAAALAAVLQPVIAVLREGREFTTRDFIAALVFGFASAMLQWIARRLAQELED